MNHDRAIYSLPRGKTFRASRERKRPEMTSLPRGKTFRASRERKRPEEVISGRLRSRLAGHKVLRRPLLMSFVAGS